MFWAGRSRSHTIDMRHVEKRLRNVDKCRVLPKSLLEGTFKKSHVSSEVAKRRPPWFETRLQTLQFSADFCKSSQISADYAQTWGT